MFTSKENKTILTASELKLPYFITYFGLQLVNRPVNQLENARRMQDMSAIKCHTDFDIVVRLKHIVMERQT